jgi:peptide subunit release factor 1 (eRF1)
MLNDSDMQELLRYQSKHPVLSVYLNTDPAQGNADAYKLRLRSMLREVELVDDVNAVTRYFDHEHDWSGKSVAVFSCVAEKFFKSFPLAVPVRSRVRVSDRPHVKPLVDLLDSYGGYGVVLVDKQGARLFYFHLGELREKEGMVGESVRRTKRGGGSQATGRRGGVAGQTDYVDEVAGRNIKDAVEFATRFFAENNVRRVLIGGTEDNIALFRSQLPKAWQSLVVGVFPISMVASHTEVLGRAMQVGMDAETRREAQLAKSVVTSSAKGRGGVINLEATLNSVREGRVQTLLIREGFRAPGYRCKGCGFVSSEKTDVCPFCGSQFDEIPDAVELAVRQVLQSGGEVEVLHSAQKVKGFDQIGALLRY